MIKIDRNIADYVSENITLFKYIHPNIISFIGIICNILIYFLIFKNIKNKLLLLILFNIRALSDILDGAIARKYNKTSKLGHYMDTFSDYLNFYVLSNYFFHKINVNKIYYYMFLVIAYIFIEGKYEMWESHDKMKSSTDFKDKIYINNTFLFNNLFYIILVLF